MSDKPNATRYSNEDKSEIDYLRDVEDWADARIAELESKVAELEHTLTAACNREGDCIARHIEGGVCCAWIGKDATPQED